jgi:BlaI family transcriptional regulator, penicillinase repressor
LSNMIGISDNEWILMQIIWDKQPCTLRQICNEADKKANWSQHAIISFLKRMEKKGTISVEDARPVKLYRALVEKGATIQNELDNVLAKVYNGNPLLLVSSLVKQQQFTDEELAELIKILQQGKDGVQND